MLLESSKELVPGLWQLPRHKRSIRQSLRVLEEDAEEE
jgi:hypothetical protein